MATVSHLPHVLANVLVAQAARVLSDEGERLPATGPSFRDATRVAGANTAIWSDIYLANADALVAAIDDTVARLSDGARRARGARRRRGRGLERRRARRPPAAARGRPRRRRGARAARRRCRTGRASSPRSRSRSGARGVNIVDMALYPAPDNTHGTIALWIAGERDAGAGRSELVEELGLHGGAAHERALRARRAVCAARSRARPTSRSRTARRCSARCRDEPVRVTGYLDAADTHSTLAAVQALGALVERRATASLAIRGAGLRAAAPATAHDRRRQRRAR